MKTNPFALLISSLVLALLPSGCATMQKPVVNTWRDPQFTPSPASTLALTDRPKPNAADARLGQLLVAELHKEGFNLVPADRADFLMTYVLENNQEERFDYSQRDVTPMMPVPPPQSTAQMNQYPGAQGLPGAQQVVVAPEIYSVRDIRLYVYTNPKTHSGDFRLAWQGSITQGNSVPEKNESALLKTLLGYLGKDENGQVPLSP